MKKTAGGWAEHILWITHTLTDANASNRTSFIKSTYGAWRRSMSATERLHCGADGETVSHRSLPPCKICFIKEGDWTLTSTSTWCFGEKQHAVVEPTDIYWWVKVRRDVILYHLCGCIDAILGQWIYFALWDPACKAVLPCFSSSTEHTQVTWETLPGPAVLDDPVLFSKRLIIIAV